MIIAEHAKRENAIPTKIKCGEMQLLSTKTQQQIEWRRNKVLELSSQGHSQRDIADTLHVNKSIISRDKFVQTNKEILDMSTKEDNSSRVRNLITMKTKIS